MLSSPLRTSLCIIVIAAALFTPFLGSVHLFDWDEINFAECSREMILLKDYSRVYIDFKPFWEKPPMFMWMQGISMKLFGVNEFAARFPNAVCGILTLLILYNIGRKLINSRFGLFWVMAYAGSVFPYLYFKSGIIDPFFNLFIFLSLYYFILYSWSRNHYDYTELNHGKWYYAMYSGAFMGLAILMKGQAGLMIFGLCFISYLAVYNRFRIFWNWKDVGLFFIIMLAVMATWYGYETWKNGPWFITEFITYQYRLFTTHDAGQKGFIGYHYLVLLIGCFPASILAIASFFKNKTDSNHELDFKRWMLILFWVVTILFSITQSRIIHYSSMAWFPLTFLGAYTLHNLWTQRIIWPKYLQVLFIVIGALWSIALLAFPFIVKNIRMIEPYIKDEFAKANLQAEVNWTGWEWLPGVLLLIGLAVGIYFMHKGKVTAAACSWFGGTVLTVFIASVTIVPRVERFSQGAAIDFFKQRQGENCYVQVLGYKSYAHLFYTMKPKPANESSYDMNWLLTGDIDKPVYFVSKIDRIKEFEQYTELKELYRKNGFVFLKREIPLKDSTDIHL